jgi:adenylate kinase family enzyme
MRIAITGASGNGKTTLARELARVAGLRHVETDALHHGPNWQSCGADVLRERVLAATEGDDWVVDSTYHGMIGYTAADRADVVVWLDLPLRRTLPRLLRRTAVRRWRRVELWNGNVEEGGWDAVRYLIWPAIVNTFRNRRVLPQRYARHRLVRLRSDAEVRAFVQSIQAQETMSGSSGASDRQNTPPLLET